MHNEREKIYRDKPLHTHFKLVTMEQAASYLSTLPDQEILQATLDTEWRKLKDLFKHGGYISPTDGIFLRETAPSTLPHKRYLQIEEGFDESIRYVNHSKSLYLHYVDRLGKRKLLDRHMRVVRYYFERQYTMNDIQNPALTAYTATTVLFHSLAQPSNANPTSL